MPTALIQSDDTNWTTPATPTKAVSLTGITAGNLLLVFVAWEGIAHISGVSDGTSAFTAGTEVQKPGSNFWGQYWWLLDANSGNKTITVTFDDNDNDFGILYVTEWSGGTWSLDDESVAGAAGTAVNTGNITTTSATGVIIFANKLFVTGSTVASPLINSGAPTEFAFSPVSGANHY